MSTSSIADPDLYADGAPHALFTELRQAGPVHWVEMGGEPGYWAVLRHADVVHVAKEPLLFSAEVGGIVIEDLPPERLEHAKGMLLSMDPPRHADYRRELWPRFKIKVVATLEHRIRSICGEILDRAAQLRDVEFVHDVTATLPSQVIGELMGLPEDDWLKIHAIAERLTNSQDPSYAGGGDPFVDMAVYAIQHAQQRRQEPPRDDLTSVLLMSDFNGKPMDDFAFGTFFVQLVTAGNDTTKTMLAAGLHALLEHPDQLAALRENRSLVPDAVEEILRWANPLHYFRRTATADTEIGGHPVQAGEKVAMIYTSANRDEAVFDDSQAFDIRRNPNPHLSFGRAEHFCLGAHLARLEARVFFDELLHRFPKIEQTGRAEHVRSNLNNALKSFPVRLTAA
ncbi:cytochrome P450 [Pseudofrankia inefficax]|uniref:Cytochrome P450 n=1 Tax=Pseudofrankia inefficax (strain DSM 45817 / CECT 9037 / DDB 130130 / EuI1c) TaxID=298654 RepID=E3IWG9_PSEI1|nr:cytochrome P450 [Pseudofrankia inefficax]ADP80152.1 cytochrome P450 [Pseudofrankia inefficax]